MTCCKVWQWRFVHLYVNMCMIMKKESTRVFRFGKNNKPPSPQVTICRRGSCSKIVVPLRRMSYRADHSGIMRKKTFNILRRKNAGLENDGKNQVEKKTELNAVPGSSVVRMFFVRTSGLWLVPGAVKYRILQQRVLHWLRSGHCSSALVYLGIPNRGISQAGLNVCGKITWKHRRLNGISVRFCGLLFPIMSMSLAWFPQIVEFFTPALQTRVAYWHAGSGTDSNSDAVLFMLVFAA